MVERKRTSAFVQRKKRKGRRGRRPSLEHRKKCHPKEKIHLFQGDEETMLEEGRKGVVADLRKQGALATGREVQTVGGEKD